MRKLIRNRKNEYNKRKVNTYSFNLKKKKDRIFINKQF